MSVHFSRRDFLRTTTAATAAAVGGLVARPSQAVEAAPSVNPGAGPLIDANVSLLRWPFRRVPLDETPALVRKLRQCGVTQAWAGSFEGLLHKDISGVNARLAQECNRHGSGLLLPFGTINPRSPGWEEDLRRCHEGHKMRGLRLHPNYHGYKLTDPAFARLLSLSSERHLLVQIALSMEDERTQHPLMLVPHVDATPLLTLLKNTSAPLVLLNWWRAAKGDLLKKLAATGKVYFDIATIENIGSIELLLKTIPADRLVFGSLAPLFYFESALLRLAESDLKKETALAIRESNATQLLK